MLWYAMMVAQQQAMFELWLEMVTCAGAIV